MGWLPEWLGGTSDEEDAINQAYEEQQAADPAGTAYANQQQELADQYEAMKGANQNEADQNIINQAMQGIGGQVADQTIHGTATNEPSLWDTISGGATAAKNAVLTPSVKGAFSSALGKLASPQGLSTAAGLGAGLIGMNKTKQGVELTTGAYDKALKDIAADRASGNTILSNIQDSPEQLAQRATALRGLTERAQMGLTPEDQAALQQINRQAAQQFQANNATIGQNMQRRGMANSGLGLAQSMGAADQALQNQALAGQNQAATSFAAKQGALNNLANQAGTALNADYGRQLGKATNLTAFNTANTQAANNAATTSAANQQKAKQTEGQGVVDLTKGVINTLNPNTK